MLPSPKVESQGCSQSSVNFQTSSALCKSSFLTRHNTYFWQKTVTWQLCRVQEHCMVTVEYWNTTWWLWVVQKHYVVVTVGYRNITWWGYKNTPWWVCRVQKYYTVSVTVVSVGHRNISWLLCRIQHYMVTVGYRNNTCGCVACRNTKHFMWKHYMVTV